MSFWIVKSLGREGVCPVCNEGFIKGSNRVDLVKGSYRGHSSYAHYHIACFLKEVLKYIPEANDETIMNKLKKEIMLSNLENNNGI